MCILIDKALKHFYMLYSSIIICKHGYILLSLTLKENTVSNMFAIIHIVEIAINKGAKSYKLKLMKIWNLHGYTYLSFW